MFQELHTKPAGEDIFKTEERMELSDLDIAEMELTETDGNKI